MKFRIYKYLLVIGIFLVMPMHSFGLENGYARIVYNISGLQNYQLHWNDRFPQGSLLMIYVEADGINHRRAVGVDYVIIIKDSNDNIIDTSVYENLYQDYRDNDFATYSRTIGEDWDDGTYTAEIHIFDLLNDTIMQQYYINVTNALLNEDTVPDIPYMNRSNITNNPELLNQQYKEIIQNFYIDKYANKYPADRFIIENISLNNGTIAPGVPVQISADVTNTFYDIGSASADIMLDNNVVGNATVDIDPFSTKKMMVTVPIEIIRTLAYGSHVIEIVPTSNDTIGFDLHTILNIANVKIEIPTQINYVDIQTDKLTVKPNEALNITVTVENNGKAGSQPIGLLINNVPIGEKNISLNFSETKEINFTISETEVGEYKVTVNNTNLIKIFFVEETVVVPEVSAQAETAKQIPKIFIIIGLLILVVLIYMVRKRIIVKGLENLEKRT